MLGLIAALAVGLVIGGAAAGLVFSQRDARPVKGEPTAPAPADPVPTGTASVPGGSPLLTLRGDATGASRTFTARGPWELRWSFDCSHLDRDGDFEVAVSGASTAKMSQHGRRGSGVERMGPGGRVVLAIASTCRWTATAYG